jgi:hypothetical protein
MKYGGIIVGTLNKYQNDFYIQSDPNFAFNTNLMMVRNSNFPESVKIDDTVAIMRSVIDFDTVKK